MKKKDKKNRNEKNELKQRESLEELLKQCPPENRHEVEYFAIPMGREMI